MATVVILCINTYKMYEFILLVSCNEKWKKKKDESGCGHLPNHLFQQ
jgi:hypothetical protein